MMTPWVEIGIEMTPLRSGLPGLPTPLGGILLPVSCVHVPDPLGSNSHNWRGLPPRKIMFPVTGSGAALKCCMPQPSLNGGVPKLVMVLFAFNRNIFCASSLDEPPPKTTTSCFAEYTAAQLYKPPVELVLKLPRLVVQFPCRSRMRSCPVGVVQL